VPKRTLAASQLEAGKNITENVGFRLFLLTKILQQTHNQIHPPH
jgi:hypothetical protein